MKPSPKQACLDDMRHRILTLAIPPGADLDETSLSLTYGISRTPLREVLQRLAADGYVELSDNRGAKVTSMNLDVMRSFFQTAPMIYASCVRLAAENRTPAQLTELKQVQQAFVAALQSAEATAMAMANHRFHELIGEMAGNAYLMPTLRRLLVDHTRLGQMFYRPAAPAETLAVRQAGQQHDAMIEAIEKQEASVAVELTLQHWDLSRDRVERFVRPDPLSMDVADRTEAKHAV